MSEPQAGEVYQKGDRRVVVEFTMTCFVVVHDAGNREDAASIGKAVWRAMGWVRVDEQTEGA